MNDPADTPTTDKLMLLGLMMWLSAILFLIPLDIALAVFCGPVAFQVSTACTWAALGGGVLLMKYA